MTTKRMNKKEPGRQNRHFKQFDNYSDFLGSDLAGTHGFTRSQAALEIETEIIDAQREQLLSDGYVILHELVSESVLEAVRTESAAHLKHCGRNSFEGERTERIYGLPEKMRSADPFIEHPLILAHLDRLLLPNYLLSQAQVINIKPESPAQPLHIDDGFYPIPAPRPAISIATIFAIDDFTEDNGATVIIPGSHRWSDERRPSKQDQIVKAVMPAASCILFMGNAWHGGGENYSGTDRLALTCQYCEPWARTQENYFLSVSKQTAACVSEDIRRLLGYSIHPPFMGMTEGMHPKRKLPELDGA